MTRMSRELSLVLLGAGVLTATYFVWDPEEKIATQADTESAKRVGGTRTRTGGGGFIFIGHIGGGGGPSSVSGRSPAMASVSKGGFGSTGSRIGGGFGG